MTLEKQVTDKMMGKISLSKDKVNLEKHVVNLSKTVVDLSKKNNVDLGNIHAKVVVVLDYSGSMSGLYHDGTVQNTLNRLVPLGLTFDDNGSIELFLFSNDFRKLDDLKLSNYENYVKEVVLKSGYSMSGTHYAPVLDAIINGYKVSSGLFKKSFVNPIVDEKDSTFILFVTDGENLDKSESDRVILASSEKNVFIQFVGIGNSTFNYLEKLDNMQGRSRDNIGFSKMSDLNTFDDISLYNNILGQFSQWLKGLH